MEAPQRETGAITERPVGLGVALCLGVAMALGLAVAILGRTFRTPSEGPQERINPNTAAASSLARLPRIGWSRAQAVVTYRQQRLVAAPSTPVFRGPGDLLQIPGFGPKTVDTISPWLDFGQAGAEAALSPVAPSTKGR